MLAATERTGMGNITLGNVTIRISATALMKCQVGLNSWQDAQQQRSHTQAVRFHEQLCTYVMTQPDALSLPELAANIINHLKYLQREQNARTMVIEGYSRQVRALLRDREQRVELAQTADTLSDWLQRLVDSAYGVLACRALDQLTGLGARLPGEQAFRDAYLTLRPTLPASTGRYVPWLGAVAVHFAMLATSPYPELEFIETLLHEQIHAVIHERMGDDGEHYRRLPWFNELTAILLSQYALGRAFAELRAEPELADVPAALRLSREQQVWGDLATAVLHETRDPLVVWRAWQAIFAHGGYSRRNYAHRSLLPTTLAQAGWSAAFPYGYGTGTIDCRDDLSG